MITYRNESYLPCALPELVTTTERKEIEDKKSPLYLQETLYSYPLNTGYLVSGRRGDFFVESLDLLRSLDGKSAGEVGSSVRSAEEIETYFRYGIVGYERIHDAKLIVPEVSNRYFQLYEETETTWFSYIPQKIELDITNQCNLRCKHCSRNASAASADGRLSLQNYVDIIRQAAALGVPDLSFMGGEPTCNPSFIELATVAKMYGIRTLSTSSNGWLIDKPLAEKMAILFDSVQISIHGADARTHDAIVGRSGAFVRACRAAELLRESGTASLNISCTVMGENADQMEAMVQLAHDLQVPAIRFLVLFSKGRGRQLDQWETTQKAVLSDKIKEFREREKGNTTVEGGGFPPYYAVSNDALVYGCPAGRSLLYISADGDARACGNLEHTIGNILNAPIMDIWHSPVMTNLRKKPSCDCPYAGICAGGCLGNEYWAKMFSINTTPIMV